MVAVLTVLAGIARYVSGVPHVAAFVIAGLALAGGAWIVSFSTEQVGHRFGTATTGLLQSTLGNLPEFFVVIFALNAGDRVVAQTTILGSILVNALFVLGLVIVVGSLREDDRVMRFSPRLPNDTATLLLISSFIILLVDLADSAHDEASHHITAISVVGAVAILVTYGFWVRQYLAGEGGAGEGGAGERGAGERGAGERGAGEAGGGEAGGGEADGPRLSTATSLTLLVAAGLAAAFVSDWFVNALQPTIHSLGISQAFAGLVIVATAGNAVEHAVGVVLAYKGRSELAISVVKNSIAQVAAFLFPLLVLVSLLTSTTLTFALAPVFTGALIGTAIIIWQITGDGEATPFEGVALIAAFVILATVAAFD